MTSHFELYDTPPHLCERIKKSGDTYFRTFGTIIGSKSLTSVFDMGTGVAFWIWSPEKDDARVFQRAAVKFGCI